MSQAITRCPACSTSFRITEQQLLAADGSVRCGACMHLFQAEDYFISPMLDVTELLAIESDYWTDFESYIMQVLELETQPDSTPDEAVMETVAVEPQAMEPQVFEPRPSSEFEDRKISFSTLVQFTEPEVEPVAQAPEVAYWQPTAEAEPEPEEQVQPEIEVGFWEPAPSELTEPNEQQDVVAYWEPVEALSIGWHQVETEDVVKVWQPEARFDEIVVAEPVDSPEPLLTSVFLEDDQLQPIETVELDVEEDPTLGLEDQRRLISLSGLKWLPGIAAMLGLVFVQYAYYQMHHFAQDVRYRHYYEEACIYIGCLVPEYHNLAELQTRELIIRSHPVAQDGLIADVLLRNSADYRQMFPSLRLKFFDINGGIVASRVFEVNEYLGGEMRGLKFIPGKTEVRLSLEIVDPGEEVSGFSTNETNQAA